MIKGNNLLTYILTFSRPPIPVLRMDGIHIMQPMDIQVFTEPHTKACLLLILLLLDQIHTINHRSVEKIWKVIMVSKGKPCIATIYYYEIYLKKKKKMYIYF